MTHALRIRIKKNTDGRASLSCTRADGSATWQRLEGQQAAFFPRHDLTHFAVESVLGYTQGFYGLVAAGWELADFAKPGAGKRIPPEGILVEMTVGMLDLERGTGERLQVADLNARLAQWCEESGQPKPREIVDEDLARVRRKRAELFAQWESVPPGEALELAFEPSPSP
jgi:hypothetical protein